MSFFAAVRAATLPSGGLFACRSFANKQSGLRFLLCAGLLFFALGSGACAYMLDPGPPPVRMQLHPAMPQPSAAAPVNKQLVVALPTAGRELENDRIALLFHGREVRFLAEARWTGAVPYLLQRKFVEALEASAVLAGVSDDVTGIVANARLLSDISMFGLEYSAGGTAPVARFSAHFRLLDLYSGKILATRTIESRAPASDESPAALVFACEKALSEALGIMTAWTGEQMRKAR